MTARRRPSLACAALALLALVGCASEPTRLPLGVTRAEALQRLGTPTGVYPLSGGGERLQYSRGPMGHEVNNVDVDAQGRVVSTRQELQESLFDRTIQAGLWREADVLRTYGRPYEVARVGSFDGVVWTWRFKSMNAPRLLHIYIAPTGEVVRYHTADDVMRDDVRW
ncbi:hypothetical protein [Variovorax sp. LT1R16]|uniref:hypothetical protein n=1 Tax=Variovorax sp. LT1R16 TaxID=3443728 RepID=UPI003F453515